MENFNVNIDTFPVIPSEVLAAPEAAAFILPSSQKVSSVELLEAAEPTTLPSRDHRNNSVNNPLLGTHKVEETSDAIVHNSS